MQHTIHFHNCPVCSSARIREVFSVKDHTVSGHLFAVWECADCKLRFTQDIPDEGHIGAYYKSDEYISHTDKAPGLINRIYRIVRKRTMGSKRKLLAKYTGLANGRLLDIGAGTGAFVNEMKKNGWEVTGLEPDPDAREAALSNYGVQLMEADSLYALPEASFDAITLWHVLEHVHDLHGYLKKLKLLLKKDGILFIAVPNYTAVDSMVYQQHWAAYDVPRHLYHFSPATIKTLSALHDLELKARMPMWFDSFYISMLSSKYKSGRTRLPSALFNGFRSNFSAMRNVEKCSSVIYILKEKRD